MMVLSDRSAAVVSLPSTGQDLPFEAPVTPVHRILRWDQDQSQPKQHSYWDVMEYIISSQQVAAFVYM